MTNRTAKKLLRRAGFHLVRSRGDHFFWRHRRQPRRVVVLVGDDGNELSVRLLAELRRQLRG
ncbi:MAG: type II toxin-antitoxin system HicA family toxin [Ktedonobacteraceae bacterium]|nr:type II toxin-antitoxin system HicA family toxin [Ktedonobacteraceae bacterium]